MRIGAISVHKETKKMLQTLGKELGVKFIFHQSRQNSIIFSTLPFSCFSSVDFKEAVDYSIKYFKARSNKKVPLILLKSYFYLELLSKYLLYTLTIDKECDMYIVWNGKKPRHLIAIQILKYLNIDIKYMENGLLPNRLVFDSCGVNFQNSVPRDRDFFEKYENSRPLPIELIPRIAKNYKKFKEKEEKLPKNFIFIPFQVDYDSQILLYSPWIKNMESLFKIIKMVSKKFDYHFLIKEHPSSNRDYYHLHKEVESIKNIKFVNGYSTQELIKESLAVITINSTVGIESLLFKKRVIVLGDAFYTIEGITKKAENINELYSILKELNSWNIEKNLTENFLKYLYYDYLIPSENMNSTEFYQKKLQENLVL